MVLGVASRPLGMPWQLKSSWKSRYEEAGYPPLR